MPASSCANVKLAMFCGGVDKWLKAGNKEVHSREVHSRDLCRYQSARPPYPTLYVKACVQRALIPSEQKRDEAWKIVLESGRARQ